MEAVAVEAEGAADEARASRDSDAVFVRGRARAFHSRDQSAHAVLIAARAYGLQSGARAVYVRGPTLAHEPDGRRQNLQRKLIVHRQNPFKSLVAVDSA